MNIRTVFRNSLLACVLTVALAGFAWAGDACNAVPWGAAIDAVEQITFLRSANGITYYQVKKVEPCGIFQLGKADVTYAFIKGKLYGSIVEIDQARDIKKVVSVLIDEYGLPNHKMEAGWDIYRWETDELKIKLKSQYSSDRVKIGTYYKPLMPAE